MSAPALDTLIAEARQAPSETRIGYRDGIASHGPAGIDAVSGWISDPRLGGFAVRVIVAAGRLGHRDEASAALAAGRKTATSEAIARDIDAALVEFPPRRASSKRRTSGDFEVLVEDLELRGRPAVQYRIETQGQAGHFNVPRSIMDQLGIPTDGMIDVDVRRSVTGGMVFSGRIGIASGTEVYPTLDEPSTAGLRALKPYESIDVTVAKAL